MAIKLFGFEIQRKSNDSKKPESVQQITTTDDMNPDSSIVASGGVYGSYFDMSGDINNETELIQQYRNMSMLPECELAIESIVNESIVSTNSNQSVEINLEYTELEDSVKTKITEEFNEILRLLNFRNYGADIFKKWYIEGRLAYHIMIDENDTKRGIIELKNLDSTKIRKFRNVKQNYNSEKNKFDIDIKDFFKYNESGLQTDKSDILISGDSIAYCTSGLMNANKTSSISYLHKAIKVLNQLMELEDAIVIYRITRAPERRVFNVEVGQLPNTKTQQYLSEIMNKFRNKIVYNSATGKIQTDKKHQSMIEDYWFPKRDGKGTEVDTLQGAENLSDIADIEYFQKKLYKSLSVPSSRMNAENTFNLGRESEVTRDELMFDKFKQKLQTKFSVLFHQLLEKQLILKTLMNSNEWAEIENKIVYVYTADHMYTETKNTEILNQRIELAQNIELYVGKYYSNEWFRKNVLYQSEEEIKLNDEEILKEKTDERYQEEEEEEE